MHIIIIKRRALTECRYHCSMNVNYWRCTSLYMNNNEHENGGCRVPRSNVDTHTHASRHTPGHHKGHYPSTWEMEPILRVGEVFNGTAGSTRGRVPNGRVSVYVCIDTPAHAQAYVCWCVRIGEGGKGGRGWYVCLRVRWA